MARTTKLISVNRVILGIKMNTTQGRINLHIWERTTYSYRVLCVLLFLSYSTLVNADDESLPFMQENQPVQFKAFVDKIVADNKLLKTQF